MALRTLLMVMAVLLPTQGWADRATRDGHVAGQCNDGANLYEYRLNFSGQARGAKLSGFELVTCPAETAVLVFGVDDPSIDPDGDHLIQIAVEAGTTVTHDQSRAILETVHLLRSRAWSGMWALGASAHPTTDVCAGPVVDYVLTTGLAVVPRAHVC